MANHLESKLYADVEGTCSGRFGYIISVIGILDIGRGTVVSGTGMGGQAEFVTRYRAIVFKPFKGEVVDGVVNNVTKVSFHSLPTIPVFWDWKRRVIDQTRFL
jgi:DNA-directed RNA polymerase II subunit RPB7